ncbi:phage portal protein [Sporosarcina beigongshangi]|uniref:phage portal protein n=1 Tax=Sporosarcina beigongshangi TaxID=2782538 RepID=UPI00193A0AD5|nr:phage portal protein [Sporosarcina beigongshangi]
MEKYKINSLEDLTPALILALIQRFKLNELPRITKLFKYYNSEQDILNRTMKDPLKPNNRVVSPWGRHISNTAQSYFIGVPVSYQSSDEILMETLQGIFNSNYEQSQNAKLSRDASVAGVGYELLYIDESGEVKFDVLNPNETFMIYDSTIKGNPLAGIRFYESYDYVTEETQMFVEVYTDENIFYYKQVDDDLRLQDEQQHYFKSVPVIPYYNNLEIIGDFQPVMHLIDAYDILVSDSLNNMESFADAYMLIKNMDMTKEQVYEMKENRVILLQGEGDAKWLTKGSQPEEIEKDKTRLVDDIHRLSGIPDLSAQRFSGAESSGAALRYKIMSLENLTAIKERYFKHSLERRIKLICNFLNVKGHSYDYTDVAMQFSRNLAADVEGITKIVKEMRGIVPDKTLLSLLPFVDDVEFELELLRQQSEDSLDGYTEIFNPIENTKAEGVE